MHCYLRIKVHRTFPVIMNCIENIFNSMFVALNVAGLTVAAGLEGVGVTIWGAFTFWILRF